MPAVPFSPCSNSLGKDCAKMVATLLGLFLRAFSIAMTLNSTLLSLVKQNGEWQLLNAGISAASIIFSKC